MIPAKSIRKLALLVTGLGLAGCTGTVKSTQNLGQNARPESMGTVATFLKTSSADGPAALKIVVSGLSTTDSSGNVIPLLSSIQQAEIRHLELAPTMLSQSTTVPSGHFSSIVATLANPELSVVDALGNVTRLTGTTAPSVRMAVSSVSIPTAFSLSAKANAGLMLDFDLQRSISRDASGNYLITPVISSAQVSDPQPGQSLVDDAGTVTTVSSGTPPVINVRLQSSGSNVTVDTNGATLWSADITQLSSLQPGQSIEITADMESSGSYMATFVGSSTTELPTTYEGLLTEATQDSSGNFSFRVAVQR
jgi:hypothetical protein